MEECFTRGRESIMKVFSSLGMEGKKAQEEREMGTNLRDIQKVESMASGYGTKQRRKTPRMTVTPPLDSGAFN